MKKKIFILFITIIIFISIIIFIKNNDERYEMNAIPEKEAKYDENTRLYYVVDNFTGEIRAASYNEEELQIYIDNPNYDPDPIHINSTNIEDFMEGPKGE